MIQVVDGGGRGEAGEEPGECRGVGMSLER